MKIFISVPMTGRKEEDVLDDIMRASKSINLLEGNGCEIIHSYFTKAPDGAGNLYYLGEAIKKMDGVDKVFFCKGWENARGCKVENYVAEIYKINCIYEK